MQNNSTCIRCGKIRIDGKSWTERVGTSLLMHTQTVCPDSECQKIVDQELAIKRANQEEKTRNLNSRRNKTTELKLTKS